MKEQVTLAERARLGIPKLDTRVEADVRAVRGTTPLRDRADGAPQWRPRQRRLAQRPGREKEKHADTAAPHTHNNTKHSGVSSVCSHAACTRKTAQHETPTCARCSCLLFQVGSRRLCHRGTLSIASLAPSASTVTVVCTLHGLVLPVSQGRDTVDLGGGLRFGRVHRGYRRLLGHRASGGELLLRT